VEVRTILTGEFGFARPSGLAYLTKKRVLLVAAQGRGRTRVLQLDPFERALGTITLPTLNASTLTFDPAGSQLLALRGRKLVTVRSDQLTGGTPRARIADIENLGLRNPQGATFDPIRRTWLILDSDSRTIVRVSPSGRLRGFPIRLDLGVGAGKLRGLARNPTDGLLYVANPSKGLLYAVRPSGKARKVYSLKGAEFAHLRDLIFAPSADPTDPAATQHLYVADSGRGSRPGRVVEFSLEPAVESAKAVRGNVVRTIRTGRLPLPSPDPSGITYLASRDTLMLADSEVEEMALYRGANLFELTRTGRLVATGTTVAYSREPTGISFDPSAGALFVSDDDKREISVVLPGLDGRSGTADDAVTSFRTSSLGSHDPEDVVFDPDSGHLFVADGIGGEVYDVDAVNGVFGDGDDRATHFDVAQYGVRDSEAIGFDSKRKTLLVVDSREGKIFELTRSGKLVRIISISAAHDPNRALAGVTVAPTSNPNDSASATSYWVTDRRVDNNANPKENDGRIYEVKLP
jgi:DNA-binding beta-propeller fold protein YncE